MKKKEQSVNKLRVLNYDPKDKFNEKDAVRVVSETLLANPINLHKHVKDKHVERHRSEMRVQRKRRSKCTSE